MCILTGTLVLSRYTCYNDSMYSLQTVCTLTGALGLSRYTCNHISIVSVQTVCILSGTLSLSRYTCNHISMFSLQTVCTLTGALGLPVTSPVNWDLRSEPEMSYLRSGCRTMSVQNVHRISHVTWDLVMAVS